MVEVDSEGDKNGVTKCSKCGKEVYMPFVCNYCGQAFCTDHRLPENHGCKNISQALPPHSRAPPTQPRSEPEPVYTTEEPEWDDDSGEIVDRYFEPDGTEVIVRRVPIYLIERPDKPILRHFSGIELKHLAIGLMMMFGVGCSMFLSVNLFFGYAYEYWEILALAGFATLAFILHEFGHKFMGIRLGNWSEFRLIKIFAILTAISIIPIPFFKIVCPGAVQVTGDTSKENMGRIAIAGPIVNLIQAAILVIIANLLSIYSPVRLVFAYAAYINAFLGLFNLFPVGPLDGLKVVRWNKTAYFLSLAVMLGFVIYSFMLIG